MARKEFLVFGAPKISEDEIAEVMAVLRSGWIGTGPRCRQFEKLFAEYIGVPHAIAVNSCTSALHLALVALGVGPGDEVITTPLTWCATANVIVHAGARPVFVDVDRRTGNIDPVAIAAAVTPRTKAIIPVHFAGRACDMDAIGDIARRRNLRVIEDAAHAIESTWRGRKVGGIGDVTAFSFYANKNVTSAEGGMATTRDAALAERIRTLSAQGTSADSWKRFRADGPAHVQVVEAGFKYNLSDLHAALGLRQLEKIEAHHKRRQELWKFYADALAGLPLVLPAPPDAGSRHALHLYSVLVDAGQTKMSRDRLRDELKKMNIGTGLHYLALHLQPYYQETFGYRRGQFPNAEFISDNTLSLPLSAAVSDRDAQDVVEALKMALG